MFTTHHSPIHQPFRQSCSVSASSKLSQWRCCVGTEAMKHFVVTRGTARSKGWSAGGQYPCGCVDRRCWHSVISRKGLYQSIVFCARDPQEQRKGLPTRVFVDRVPPITRLWAGSIT